tara:strand:- start:344 stop:568 length:225 start_codon:yes stop_codon:yes gene_type:complete
MWRFATAADAQYTFLRHFMRFCVVFRHFWSVFAIFSQKRHFWAVETHSQPMRLPLAENNTFGGEKRQNASNPPD